MFWMGIFIGTFEREPQPGFGFETSSCNFFYISLLLEFHFEKGFFRILIFETLILSYPLTSSTVFSYSLWDGYGLFISPDLVLEYHFRFYSRTYISVYCYFFIVSGSIFPLIAYIFCYYQVPLISCIFIPLKISSFLAFFLLKCRSFLEFFLLKFRSLLASFFNNSAHSGQMLIIQVISFVFFERILIGLLDLVYYNFLFRG